MKVNFMIAAVTAAAVVAVGFAATPAEAAKRKPVAASRAGVNVSYRAGPRTRVYVTRRSWLDAGTEVVPGERKFTDYAFPLSPSLADSNDFRGGFRRQVLPDPWDLPNYPKY
ncbi:MAG: hypothetical protein EPO23_14370 [Xanthobacteraceae bacterium]|nr:MAG: hypothetical protein EPO23_14370 [Xanthobacteraceae bacterium]